MMERLTLEYAPTARAAVGPASVSIFADRAHVRAELVEDLLAVGCGIAGEVALRDLATDLGPLQGAVVVLDCPALNAARLAALSRIDDAVFQAGIALVVSTSIGALEEVFACLDRSEPILLVEPSRGERLAAIGRALARPSSARVRDFSQEDRIAMLRLAEQVERLAQQTSGESGGLDTLTVRSPAISFNAESEAGNNEGDRLVRRTRPSLPDPRLVRRMIRQRQARGRFFDGALFADPAWDILLDLTAARAEYKRVSVTSLCIASGVPPTTALRWIGQMTEDGLLQRVADTIDRRRAYIALSDGAADAMARYFAEIGEVADSSS
ncbi:MarR family transcriptional regulator [Erythrobacter sp. 3-20A1M]|uniref:MarR family transcriptional regulator n=1 Tax=Erythrobacter sp. 3-20A1M TaxID=2653850 RepID=UPI00203BF65B|nr:MarR family transcriptional regulator [Erythrobacter sp. 3-20A1M]